MTKTQKILAVYHLLTHSNEFEPKEIIKLMPDCSKKTLQRAISLLKTAGVQIHYKRSAPQAYVMRSEKLAVPRYPDDRAGTMYLDKIIRLITVMEKMENVEDLIAWYRITFPNVSPRTMQRDFAILNSIGYEIKYEREGRCWSEGDPPRYIWNYNYNTYSPDTFPKGEI